MTATPSWAEKIQPLDERRLLALPGDTKETLNFCVEHLIHTANEAITENGYFAVALSGGSTPKAIFHALAEKENIGRVEWSRCLVFWSDERSVSPDDKESNYRMAMDSGWRLLSIPEDNIFRMKAENEIEQHAKEYEELILAKIPQRHFDFVMLGMGEDGHTASLFPNTHALHVDNSLVTANYVPQKSTWRMTLTFKCINSARHAAVYVIGKEKAQILKDVLLSPYQPDLYPVQRVGNASHKALWVADNAAAALLKEK